jgi:hypothetical protein
MSKVIRISEETFIRLQELAEPLVDTPATVIERLLDFYERERRRPENVRRVLQRQIRHPDEHVMMSPIHEMRMERIGAVVKEEGAMEYFGVVPNLFLVPVSREHVSASIGRAVPYAKAERFILPRQRIQLQRAIEGASTFQCYAMSESNRPVFESMRPGDYVLLTVAGSEQFNYLARAVTKFESEELGRELWPVDEDEDDQPLSLIYALEDVQQVAIDHAKLNRALGYSPRYSVTNAIRVDPKRLEPQLVEFGGIEGLLWDL